MPPSSRTVRAEQTPSPGKWISNLQPALSSVEFATESRDVLTEFPHRPALVTGEGFHLDSVLRQYRHSLIDSTDGS